MPKSIARQFHNAVSVALFHARVRLSRFRRTWRYALRRLDCDDAQTIIVDCQEIMGRYPLSILTVESVLAQGSAEFGNHAALPALVEEACAVVAQNWRNNGRDLASVQEWALSIARSSAMARGIARAYSDFF